MANSIDNKVVSIEFNNASFESKIATTLKSIENLQKSLTFEGAKAGFADLSKAADGVTLNGISEGIEGVSNKFIALSTIGITALATLTSAAINAGLNIAKSLAIQPIAQGFQEYELKMGAIQTIMAGSGASLEEVNRQLQNLNTYSDQTIYSFADMTQNIGKFTNAGVDLDTSVSAIKGIANVAALSGANAEEAARSMYNFAQSLSSGSVKLMDWKSIEFANMATVEFKTQLLESAVAAGTLTKQADGMYTTLEGTPVTATKGFNESLQEQWLTSEALITTLGNYSDATTDIGARATAAATEVKTFTQLMGTVKESVGSGWASSFEILFGNFEEAKSLFTGINQAIGGYVGASADARNALLQGWKDLGGRELLLDSLGTAFYALGKALAPIKEAFRDIFPKQTAEGLFSLTQSFAVFTQKLIPTEETVDKIRRIFSGFFSAIKIGIEVVKGVFSVFSNLFGLFSSSGAGGGILEFFALIGDGITALKEVLVDGRKIETFFDGINDSVTKFVGSINFEPVIDAFNTVKDAIVDFVTSIDFTPLINAFDAIKDAVQGLFNRDLGVPEAASESFNVFKQIVSGLADVFQQIIDKVGAFISGMGGAANAVGDGVSQVGTAVSDIFTAIGEAFEAPDFDFDKVMKIVAAGLFGGLIGLIAKFLKNGIKIDFGQFKLMDELKDVLGGVTANLKAMQTNIQADTLMKIAIALGVLTASILVLSLIDGDDLAKALGALSVGIIQLSGAMYALTKMTEDTAAAAKFILLAVGLTILAGAVLLLGLSAKLLSGMSWEEISRGLYGVIGLLGAMAGAVKLMNDSSGMISAGIGILAISAGLLVMGLALRLISTLGWEEIAKGLVGVTGGLLTMSYAMSKIPTSGMVQAGISILIISGSLFVLGKAIETFASMDLKTVGEGLLYIGSTLAVIITAMNAIDSRQVLQVSAAMLLAGLALIQMANAVDKMGSMAAGDIAKGVAGLGLTLLLLSTAMKAIEKGGPGNAIILYLMARGLGALAGVLEAIGTLPWQVILLGLAGIAGVLGTIIAAGYLAEAALPGLLGLGAAIFLIAAGIGVLAGGIGLLGLGFKAFAEGLGLLAENGEAGLQAFIAMIDDFLLILPTVAVALGLAAVTFAGSFLSGFATLIPEVVKLLIALLDAIIEVAPKLWEAAQTLIIGFLKNIQKIYPELVRTGIGMILALLQGIKDNIRAITSAAIGIVTEFINGMAEGIPDYVRAMVNLFTTVFTTVGFELGLLMVTLGPTIGIAFIDGVLTGISMTVQKIKDFFGEWAGQILDWVKSLFGINSPSTMFMEIGVDLILGLLKGIVDTIGQVSSFFLNLATDILGWIGDVVGKLTQKGIDFIVGLWEGIKDKWESVKVWVKNIPTMVINAIGDTISDLWSAGMNFMQGLWNGLIEKGKDVLTWLGDFAEDAIRKITHPWEMLSPSKRTRRMGGFFMEGLALGIQDESKNTLGAVTKIAEGMVDALAVDEKEMTQPLLNAMHTLNEALSISNEFNPTITPVLDLTQVTRDAKLLKSLYPNLSSSVASNISAAELEASSTNGQPFDNEPVGGVSFVQYNNSPKALSTNDIYRQTKNQIAIAKEELSIR